MTKDNRKQSSIVVLIANNILQKSKMNKNLQTLLFWCKTLDKTRSLNRFQVYVFCSSGTLFWVKNNNTKLIQMIYSETSIANMLYSGYLNEADTIFKEPMANSLLNFTLHSGHLSIADTFSENQ